jgi:hypothetical protein
VCLFAFAYFASINPKLCTSFQFQLLAGGFALGAALAGGFIGGGAGAQGKAGSTGFSLVFGLTGGAALFAVTLVVFSIFAPKGCDVILSEQMKSDLGDLARTKASLESISKDLDSMTSANATARAEIKRLVTAIQGAFSNAGKLSTSLSNITKMVTASWPDGHGTDPWHAEEIRTVSGDASKSIATLDSIVRSVPAELRNQSTSQLQCIAFLAVNLGRLVLSVASNFRGVRAPRGGDIPIKRRW